MAKKKIGANLSKSSKILYTVAVIVIIIPLVFLIYIYFGAKENSGSPTVGSRFDDSLNPAISEKQVAEVKSSLNFDGIEKVEVNLISATLRVNIDMADDASAETIESVMNQAYDNVNKVLPIETYFTNNKKSVKMYDLEVNVYNYIPNAEKTAAGQILMIKTKTAAAEAPNISVPTTAKNQEVADKLLNGQAQAEKDAEGQ